MRGIFYTTTSFYLLFLCFYTWFLVHMLTKKPETWALDKFDVYRTSYYDTVKYALLITSKLNILLIWFLILLSFQLLSICFWNSFKWSNLNYAMCWILRIGSRCLCISQQLSQSAEDTQLLALKNGMQLLFVELLPQESVLPGWNSFSLLEDTLSRAAKLVSCSSWQSSKQA